MGSQVRASGFGLKSLDFEVWGRVALGYLEKSRTPDGSGLLEGLGFKV